MAIPSGEPTRDQRAVALIGTWRDARDGVAGIKQKIQANGGWASQWSFPIKEEALPRLSVPFNLYAYIGNGLLGARLRVTKFETSRGNKGLESPWPNLTDERWRGRTRESTKSSDIFKTWFLIDRIELLDPPLEVSAFDISPFSTPKGLLNQTTFGYLYDRDATVPPLTAGGQLRRSAAALIDLANDAVNSESTENDADPLQIFLDGLAYPASALLGLTPGAAPSDQDLAAIADADAVLRAAPDPLDHELDALAARSDLSTEARREIATRIGQGRFRAALIQLHRGCSVTGISTPEVLRAAHIHRWADCVDTPAARLDINNGLLLTANLDALFEVGLIAFEDEGGILISSRLDADAQTALGVHAGMRLIATPSAKQRVYLAKHRDRTRAMRVDGTA